LNLAEHVYVLVELIFILHNEIIIHFDTFKQHLPNTLFQLEIGKMEIDEMFIRIKDQNLHIASWNVTEKNKLTKINLGYEKNLQQVKVNIDLELVVSSRLIELLKEFKDIFLWIYKNLKGIPFEIA
jgi:hypothetical protein